MKTNMIRKGLACLAFPLAGTAAVAGGPISDTPIGPEHDPQGVVTHGPTDASGTATFTGLRPGRYAVVLTGRDLIAALDRAAARGGGRIALTADIPIADPAPNRMAARGGHRAPCLTIAIVGGSVAAPTVAPVCRAAAGRGLRTGFTVPGRAGARDTATVGVRVTISDQASASNLTSY